MAKVYLSAAAHATDNATKCPTKCGENVHCNQYMDIVQKRLTDHGFEVKRGDKVKTGSEAMISRVKEANAWKADIYYVAHTNAGGGRYSMTMCYPNTASKAKADVFHKYRKYGTHKVKERSDLYEINATAMPCLYDELFFHDNAEDCKWFHSGGMVQLAEETVHALCNLCGVRYGAAQGEDKTDVSTNETVYKPTVKEWQKEAIADGFKFPKCGADGVWGSECESVAKDALIMKRNHYLYQNLTKIVQLVVGVTADGLCGTNTDKAIREWQKRNGLTVDGIIGVNSWKKILL